MYKTFAYPAEKTYTTLWNMINPDNGLVIGLGKNSAWANESAPPAVDLAATEQEELFCYIPVTKRKVATLVSTLTAESVEIDGKFYEVADVESLDDIRLSIAKRLLAEIVVDHNLLPAGSFRSIGLYRFIEYADLIDPEAAIFFPGDITASLYYLEHFKPINKTANLLQTFKLVVSA